MAVCFLHFVAESQGSSCLLACPAVLLALQGCCISQFALCDLSHFSFSAFLSGLSLAVFGVF